MAALRRQLVEIRAGIDKAMAEGEVAVPLPVGASREPEAVERHLDSLVDAPEGLHMMVGSDQRAGGAIGANGVPLRSTAAGLRGAGTIDRLAGSTGTQSGQRGAGRASTDAASSGSAAVSETASAGAEHGPPGAGWAVDNYSGPGGYRWWL